MSMHQGLDLSKFKRVGNDKNTYTLRHDRGHEIKIAHKGISPKMQAELARLPVYMAKGGDTVVPGSDEEGDRGPEFQQEDIAPVAAAEEPVVQQDAATAPDVTPDQPAAPEPTPVAAPEPPPEEAPAYQSPRARPSKDDNIIDVIGHKHPLAVTAQDIDNQNALFEQDMVRGHVKHETIQSLYAKKDTLGKIGTLFGMLVSGVGSGLTGQPNAVLEMMNNQIKNDFEDQQKSNENAQNWLRLSQAHELNKANINRMGTENEESRARINKTPSEIQRNEAESEASHAAAQASAATSSLTMARLGAAGYVANKVIAPMPNGPDKARAEAVFKGQYLPDVKTRNAADSAVTGAKIGAIGAITANKVSKIPPSSPEEQKVDLSKIRDAEDAYNKAASINIAPPKYSMSPDIARQARTEAAALDLNRGAVNVWKKSFEELDELNRTSLLNQKNYDVIQKHLEGQLILAHYPKDVAHDMSIDLLPEWDDYGRTRYTKMAQGYDQFKNNERGLSTLDTFPGLRPPFPAPPQLAKEKAEAAKQQKRTETNTEAPKTQKSKSGKDMVWRNNQWEYAK